MNGGTGVLPVCSRNGIAVIVFVGQLPKLFGFSTDADGVFTYLGVGIWGPAIEANPLIEENRRDIVEQVVGEIQEELEHATDRRLYTNRA